MHTIKVTLLLFLLVFQIPVSAQDSNAVACGFDESELDLSLLKNIDTRNFKRSEEGFYSCRIAVDIDFDTYKHFGFNEELIRFELNKMFQKVSLLYEKEINTKLIVSEVHIWKSENEDPYKNETDIFKMLSVLRNNAIVNTVFSQELDLYMYLPTKNFLGAGGLASGSGNVSPWGEYKTMAHEIGHNFGSPHTQSCSWENGPLDFCYPSEGTCYENVIEDIEGTVMSYCSFRKTTFHPQVRSLTRSYASQNFRFIDSVPTSPILETTKINSFNAPYTSFQPVVEANKYYYEVATNPSFENIIFSDTVSFPSIYFNDYTNFDEYYFRVKAINQKGVSAWSNSSKIIRESNNLAIPIPNATYNKKYLNLSSITNERIDFSEVKNAQGYDIEIFRYNGSFLPVRDYFSYSYQSTTNSVSIKDIAAYFSTDFMWRVRAYNGNQKGSWSELQYIFDKEESLVSDFNLRGKLPTSFTISRNNHDGISYSFELEKTNNGQSVKIPESKIKKEKNRYLFLDIDANSTYKLTSNIYTHNHQIWEEKESGLQYSFDKTLSTSDEPLPNNWELFSTEDSTTEFRTHSRKFSKNYMFIQTNNGLFRYDLKNEKRQIFNTENSLGLIGNQIHLMEIDSEGNLWLLQQISKRLDFSGVFPNPVYSLMKFNPDNMALLERFDFEHADIGELLDFDPNQMVFFTESKLMKFDNGKLESFLNLSDINQTYRQSLFLGFKAGKYWSRMESRDENFTSLLSISLDDKSIEMFNYKSHPNLPIIFSNVFFNELGNPLIINPENNNVLKLQGNQFVTEADLSYPGGSLITPTYNKGIFTARIFSFPDDGIYKFYNNKWNKLSVYPKYIYAFYQNFADQTGNVWLSTNSTLTKIDVCSEISAPKVTAETQVNFDNPTTIEVSSCSDVNWSFNNFIGTLTDNSGASKTLKPTSSFTYRISCNIAGCTSDEAEGEIVVIPKLTINSAVSNTICSNDVIRYSPTIQGQYSPENQFSLILSNNEGQNFKVNGTELAEGPYLLDNAIPAGKYWTKLKSSHPESFSSDSVLVNIVKSADVSITGVPDICNGEIGNLTAEVTGNGPFNYFWADGQSQVLSRDVSFSITKSGTYQLGVVDVNGCNFLSELITSSVIDLTGNITANGSTELAGNQTVDLLVDYNASWTYEWKLNNESTSFGSTNNITVNTPGIYTVEIQKGSCVFETEVFQIKQILASKEDSPQWEIKIAPNPTEKYLHINLPINTSGSVSFQLLSTNGKLLKSWKSSSKVQRIDISSLKGGLYYLKSQTDNKTSTKKFIRN